MYSSQQSGESSGMASTPAAEEVHIGAASAVHLSPFWRENLHLWFAQVESAFVIHRITNDGTKFRYVILHLDPGVLPLVADIVTSPPDGERYVAIKERLTTVLGETSATRLRRPLALHELGDDKSSVILALKEPRQRASYRRNPSNYFHGITARERAYHTNDQRNERSQQVSHTSG